MIMLLNNVVFVYALTSILLLGMTASSFGQSRLSREWAGWAGPNGDFSAEPDPRCNYSLAPKQVWELNVGMGNSAVVSNGRSCVIQFSTDGGEALRNCDLLTGDLIWQTSYATDYQSRQYPGPHSTPVIGADFAIAVSIDGVVRRFDLETGRTKWTVDLRDRFGMKLPQSGYAASPLLCSGKVIVPTLGESQQVETESYRAPRNDGRPGMVALDVSTGDTVWKSSSFRSSHASPILIEIVDREVVCLHGMFELVGIDPANGKLVWRHLLRRNASDNVSFTPLWDAPRSQLIVCHGYCSKGAQAIGVRYADGQWKTKLNWSNRDMRIVHTNAILVDGIIVGTNRDPSNIMVGIRCDDGKTRFRQRGSGKSNFVRIGDGAISVSSDGILHGLQIDSAGFEEIYRLQFSSEKSWTVASVVGKHLICRGGDKLFAFEFH